MLNSPLQYMFVSLVHEPLLSSFLSSSSFFNDFELLIILYHLQSAEIIDTLGLYACTTMSMIFLKLRHCWGSNLGLHAHQASTLSPELYLHSIAFEIPFKVTCSASHSRPLLPWPHTDLGDKSPGTFSVSSLPPLQSVTAYCQTCFPKRVFTTPLPSSRTNTLITGHPSSNFTWKTPKQLSPYPTKFSSGFNF